MMRRHVMSSFASHTPSDRRGVSEWDYAADCLDPLSDSARSKLTT
jgi:hypothetical protein